MESTFLKTCQQGTSSDHCGAEWSTLDGRDATTTFGNPNNYRLFCYVPSCYKVEFLVPWIVCDRNKEYLVQVDEKDAVKQNLFDKTDPEKRDFLSGNLQEISAIRNTDVSL